MTTPMLENVALPASAPGGVARLRVLIRDLAVTGGQLFASRYQAYLPTVAELQAELARERALIGDRPTEAGA